MTLPDGQAPYVPARPAYPAPAQPPARRSRATFWLKGPGVIVVIVAVGLVLFAISALSGTLDTGKARAEADVTSCEVGGSDSLPTGKVGLTVKNISDKTRSFSVDIEYRDSGGARIDTDTAYVRNVAPGDTVRTEESTLLDAPVSAGTCVITGVSS